jgi:hypothetical protein
MVRAPDTHFELIPLNHIGFREYFPRTFILHLDMRSFQCFITTQPTFVQMAFREWARWHVRFLEENVPVPELIFALWVNWLYFYWIYCLIIE